VESYKKGKIKFELQGEKLSGIWNLVRTHQEGKQKPWFLIKHQDAAARPEAEYDVVKEHPDSVLSDRTIIPKKRRGMSADPQPVEQVPKPRKRSKSGTLTGAQVAPLPTSSSLSWPRLLKQRPLATGVTKSSSTVIGSWRGWTTGQSSSTRETILTSVAMKVRRKISLHVRHIYPSIRARR
jgi:hypothetical protein